jgi:hypothetical protein
MNCTNDEAYHNYKKELRELKQNMKPIINSLTMLAEDYAVQKNSPSIVRAIEEYIYQASHGGLAKVMETRINLDLCDIKGHAGHQDTRLVPDGLDNKEFKRHRLQGALSDDHHTLVCRRV